MAGGRVKGVEEPERRCPGYHRRCFALAARFSKRKPTSPSKRSIRDTERKLWIRRGKHDPSRCTGHTIDHEANITNNERRDMIRY